MTENLIDEFDSDEDLPLFHRDVRRRWEGYRLHYLKFVGGVGGLLMLISLLMVRNNNGMVAFILIGALIYFILGNICFSLGYVVESFAKIGTGKYLTEEFAHRLYLIGFWFSMILTCGLGVLFIAISTGF